MLQHLLLVPGFFRRNRVRNSRHFRVDQPVIRHETAFAIGAAAAVACLAGCSRTPDLDSSSEAPAAELVQDDTPVPVEFERMVVPVTNVFSTAVLFRRNSPPPWDEGNHLSFHFRKPAVQGQMEEHLSWSVVNMHADNFGQITRRLNISSVEIHVFEAKAAPSTIQEAGRPERTIMTRTGYAVITDDRIPRSWLLSEPGKDAGRQGQALISSELVQELKKAHPGIFRASE